MPLLDDPSQQPAERDDLDDLFNQDLSMDDVFKDTNTNDSTLNGQPDPKRRNNDSGTGLGIDEEIKVTKRRQPIAKLDEAR
ncbi:MAG: chromosome segregation in meiosis- protein [Bathelium mastoideum]|nr:MAG: chromosome segregation in meiosis- protein [Bathelium mastoideum]